MLSEMGVFGLKSARESVKVFHPFPHENAELITRRILGMLGRTYKSLGLVYHTCLQGTSSLGIIVNLNNKPGTLLYLMSVQQYEAMVD